LLNDATRASLKVLLHLGNESPSFPVFHSTHKKSHIRTCNFPSAAYNITHCWNICRDFKVTALLLAVAYPGILFSGGSTNSVADRGQGCGGDNPLARGSGGSCNFVQEISFHIVKFY